MGCMRRIGCLVTFVVIAIIAFLTRDQWLRILPGGGRREAAGDAANTQTWQALTPAGAQRAKAALDRLSAPNGPVFATVAPGDLAAYIFQELSRSLPSSADSIQAAAIGDRLYVRAVIRTSDLGGKSGLGPFGALLGERERVQLGGVLHIIRPGFAELQVKEFKIRDFGLPQGIIPRLIRQMSRANRPPELSADGLPLTTPAYIGDVRVSSGRITLYKTTATK